MPIGVRDMGFNTAINLSLTIGMTNYSLFNYPPNPKAGTTTFNTSKKMWEVFNGACWVEVNLREHKCKLDEKPIQD